MKEKYKEPLVSICIPTYSRLNYLKQTVASALNQSYKNFEICVAQNPKDNGADKDIKNWCESKMQEGLINYRLNKSNLGLSGNLNVLTNFAKGDYVIYIGDDDLLSEHFVLKLMENIDKDSCAIRFSSQFFINSVGTILEDETVKLNHIYKRDVLEEGILTDPVVAVFNNSIPLSASLIKREIALRYPFDEELNTPDFPFFLKVALNNEKFYFLNEKLAFYRLHNNSETNKGLTTDKLLEKIHDINLPEKYQPLKQQFISNKIIPSINRALKSGNKKLAGFLLHSSYYPPKKLVKIIQEILRLLPTKLTTVLLNLKKK